MTATVETIHAEQDVLGNPDILGRLHETAETAVTLKLAHLGYKGVKLHEAREQRTEDVSHTMWMELAESDNAAEIVTNPRELAKLAGRVTSRMFYAEQSVKARLEAKGTRTDNAQFLRNWELMGETAIVTEASRLCRSGDITTQNYTNCLKAMNTAWGGYFAIKAANIVEKAKAVLASHSLLNEVGKGGPVRIVQEATKAWEGPKRTHPKYRDKPVKKGQVDAAGGIGRNLAYAYARLTDVHITTNMPVPDMNEFSLKMSRSAETVYFRSIRENNLRVEMSDIADITLFVREGDFALKTDGSAVRRQMSVNWTEAYKSRYGCEPSKAELMRFIRAIRHQSDYFRTNAGIREVLVQESPNGTKALDQGMWLNAVNGLHNAQNVAYSDEATGTCTIYTREPQRPESDILAEIAQNRLGRDTVAHFIRDWMNGDDPEKLAGLLAQADNLRKAGGKLHSELIGWND